MADDYMPGCLPTPACMDSFVVPPPSPPPPRTAILFVLDANASNLRFFYGRAVRKAYASQLGLLVRAVHSLRRVNTTLPIRLLVSGDRVPSVEERLTQLGVGIIGDRPSHGVPSTIVPSWGSKWARASFAKLRALALYVDPHFPLREGFDKVIVLDTDTIVLRNIDHLANFPAPAFVAQYKCYPRAELRGALMAVQPSEAMWTRARELMTRGSTAVYDDLGEGSVWRHMYPTVNELPIGYAALRSSNLSATDWLHKVHVLHDPNLLRKAASKGFKAARMDEDVLKPIGLLQGAEVKDHITPLLAAASPPQLAGKGSKKARGRRKRST